MNTDKKIITYSLIVIIFSLGYWWWNNSLNTSQRQAGATVTTGCCTFSGGATADNYTFSQCNRPGSTWSAGSCRSTPTRPTGGGNTSGLCCWVDRGNIRVAVSLGVGQSKCPDTKDPHLCFVNTTQPVDPITRLLDYPSNYFNTMTQRVTLPAAFNPQALLAPSQIASYNEAKKALVEGVSAALNEVIKSFSNPRCYGPACEGEESVSKNQPNQTEPSTGNSICQNAGDSCGQNLWCCPSTGAVGGNLTCKALCLSL